MNAGGKTRGLITTALLAALTYLFTRFINIQPPMALGGGGLVHLGNVMVVISAVVFGKKEAAASAALGMALFDLTSGYVIWAPFTLVIRGAMGYVLGSVSQKGGGSNTLCNAAAVLVSGAVMVAGYYVAQAALYGNLSAPMLSVPGDLAQVAIGLFIGLPLASAIKKVVKPQVFN